MARNPASVGTRLRKLKAARQRVFALDRGSILSATPMAKLLGVTWPVLRDWCNEIEGFAQSGAFDGGAQGIEYEFCPVRTLWFLIDHFQAENDRLTAKNRDGAKSAGLNLDDDDDATSFEEIRGRVRLTLDVVSAAREQQHTTPTSDMLAFVDGYNQAVVSGIMGVRTKVDPSGLLPPDLRGKVDRHLRDVAADAHGKAERFIEDFRRAGLQRERTRRAG